MRKKIISLCLIFIVLFVFGCEKAPSTQRKTDSTANSQKTTLSLSTDAISSVSSPILPCAEDAGQSYINSFVFLGESTTSHLKNRGVLSGGTKTTQVWSTKSGTLMLDLSTSNCRIIYPETNEELDLVEAMRRKKPKFILLTFGLNGAVKSMSDGKEYFKGCYRKLINTLLDASPSTTVLLQSCFPIAENMDMSNYSVDASTLNSYIDILNTWTCELASELALGYLNTSEILKDSEGFLYGKHQVGDGYHLTKEAYIEILKYIRTHPYTKKEI